MVLDREIKEITSKNPAQALIASHPVYDYFARRYQLNLTSIHWEPDLLPTTEQWIQLRGKLNGHPAGWMIWEGAPLKESMEALQNIGIKSLVFAPCGNVPDSGDFLSVMKENIQSLKSAY